LWTQSRVCTNTGPKAAAIFYYNMWPSSQDAATTYDNDRHWSIMPFHLVAVLSAG
jgi:hypothetical protein